MSTPRFLRCLVRLGLSYRHPLPSPTSINILPNYVRCFSNIHKIDPEDPRTIPEKEWEKRLTPEQFSICREKGTEAPFSGKYVNHFEKGIYNCICCGEPLFSSESKFDSSCGWPSFSGCLTTPHGREQHDNVLERPDNTGGMNRVEVMCKKCDAHLGHVFNDGPAPTGKRYCINSIALDFTPKK